MNINSNSIMANMFLPGRSWGLNACPTHADDRVTRGAIDPLNCKSPWTAGYGLE